MPSQKHRSKEDTWTTDELSKALNKTGERRHHRDRDEDRKRERINGEDKHRRRDDDDRRRRHRDEEADRERLTEEERERQREERRRKREGKDGGDKKKGKELQFRGKSDNKDIELNDVNDDDGHKRHRSDRDRERRHRDDEDREKRHHDRERRHRDEEERPRRHKDDDNDRRRRHHDDDDREKRRKHRDEDDEDERERRRRERRREKEEQEEEERRRRHEEKKERRKEEERRKEKDDRKRDKDREKDRDRHKDRKPRESEEDRREREREERRKEREERKSKQKQEEVKQEEPEEDAYDYEEDFEDYDDDFEDDDEDEDNATAAVRNNHETIHKQDRGGTRLDYSDSEVNDVLRALDAENDRLLNTSSRSPQVSANYGRSSYQDDSDKDPDSDDDYKQTYQPRQNRPRTAINFVSAKQRAVNKKTANKTMQRGKDLLAMLDLDFASFDIMDLPPVNEYDLYIRAFGSSDTRQAYVQTNEDNVERDIQTEEIDVRQKWTQHPAQDFRGYGRGDGEKDIDDEEESQNKEYREQDHGRLHKFLEKAEQVIAILLEENKDEESGSKGQNQSNIGTSEGFTQLDLLPILQGRHVVYSHFSPIQPNLLLTVYSSADQMSDDNPVSKRGVICMWNTNDPRIPQKILVCTSQPRCCCFSPVRPSLVFAGMVDGSIAMWDLREPSSIHRPTVVNEEAYSLRYPTYDTACVLKEENHHSPVSSIVPIYTYTNTTNTDSQHAQASEESSSGLSFQLVSTEESAVLHFWVVAEIGAPDIAGSENDLGLAPGAGVKLLKSSSLTLNNPSKDIMMQSSVRANDMALIPNDPNHFYVATDAGNIIHGIRFGKRVFPRAHSPVIESVVDVVSIDFSPFDQPCFLAGCSDGTFSIYHTKAERPLISWSHVTEGRGIQCVRWSRCRPCVFYILDTASTLYVYDLLEGDMKPNSVETISKERVTSFSLTTVQRPDGMGTSNRDGQMLFSFEGGKTEIHTITKALRTPENLETEYLGSYLQRF